MAAPQAQADAQGPAIFIANEADTISIAAANIAGQLRQNPPAMNQGQQILQVMTQGFADVRQDITDLRRDIADVRQDITNVRRDVASLETRLDAR